MLDFDAIGKWVTSMLAAFMSREVDVVSAPAAEVESLENLGFAEIHTDSSGYPWGLNLTHKRFTGPRVRQAIVHAINRRQIVSGLLRGHGFIVNSPFAPDSIVCNPSIAEYPFDSSPHAIAQHDQ